MGEIDIKKEWPNVRRMQVLGATVVPATEGGKSLKEAVDSACKFLDMSLIYILLCMCSFQTLFIRDCKIIFHMTTYRLFSSSTW